MLKCETFHLFQSTGFKKCGGLLHSDSESQMVFFQQHLPKLLDSRARSLPFLCFHKQFRFTSNLVRNNRPSYVLSLKVLSRIPDHSPIESWSMGNRDLFFVGTVYIVIITIINVAAVGYQLVPVTSTIFNESYVLWYERILPKTSWIPQSRSCDGSVIKLQEGQPISDYSINLI